MSNPNPPISITVYWSGDANGYPTANDITVPGKLNSATTITWVAGPGIASIDGFNFTSNPQGSMTPPVQRHGVWTAVDTIKGNDRLKYLVQATSSAGHGQKWSPDPMVENEVRV